MIDTLQKATLFQTLTSVYSALASWAEDYDSTKKLAAVFPANVPAEKIDFTDWKIDFSVVSSTSTDLSSYKLQIIEAAHTRIRFIFMQLRESKITPVSAYFLLNTVLTTALTYNLDLENKKGVWQATASNMNPLNYLPTSIAPAPNKKKKSLKEKLWDKLEEIKLDKLEDKLTEAADPKRRQTPLSSTEITTSDTTSSRNVAQPSSQQPPVPSNDDKQKEQTKIDEKTPSIQQASSSTPNLNSTTADNKPSDNGVPVGSENDVPVTSTPNSNGHAGNTMPSQQPQNGISKDSTPSTNAKPNNGIPAKKSKFSDQATELEWKLVEAKDKERQKAARMGNKVYGIFSDVCKLDSGNLKEVVKKSKHDLQLPIRLLGNSKLTAEEFESFLNWRVIEGKYNLKKQGVQSCQHHDNLVNKAIKAVDTALKVRFTK